METREGKAWGTLFMHLVQVSDTMHLYLGGNGWTLREVHEYTLRRLQRGDIAYTNDRDRENSIMEWSVLDSEMTHAYTAFNDAHLKSASVFGIFEYDKNVDPAEEGMSLARYISEKVAEANNWSTVPKVSLTDWDDFATVEQGVLNMRIDLLAASTGVPRTVLPIGFAKGLLERDDAVMESFEYLLHIQGLPGISEENYREASHLLHRVSTHRWGLMDRIKREGIHVESNPDLKAT